MRGGKTRARPEGSAAGLVAGREAARDNVSPDTREVFVWAMPPWAFIKIDVANARGQAIPARRHLFPSLFILEL